MKILLTAVNAKYIHSNPAVYSLQKFTAEHAPEYKTDIELAEFTINHYPDDILQEIYRRKPDVAAFSCYIWNLQMIEKVIEDLPKVLPDIQIWVGGPEVSYDAPDFLRQHPQVAGVMTGEGEETFLELTAFYHGKGQLEDIQGITFRNKQDEIIVNPGRALLDMNRIPFLYDELEDFEHRIIYYESSRGCPFSCSYCLSSIDKSVRFRDAQTVVRELQFFLDRKVPQVKFVDRTFNCRHSHALTIWTYIKEHDNGITNFHFEIAADLLNEEELTLLGTMRPGLVQLEIGVQSTNLYTIQEIDRIMDFTHLSNVVKRIQSGHNIHQHLDLIAGLPGEDFHSFQKSFNDVYHLYPDQFQLGFLKVLKGSKMQEKANEYGIIYHSQPVYEVFSTNWISYEEILKLKEIEEMVEVYYNSGQFSNTMRYLEREFADPFSMYQSLAAYYGKRKWWNQSHSRMQRFEMLREFIQTVSSSHIYDELLLMDLYLRENSKSRPKWAADLQNEKKQFLDWFKEEAQEHKVLAGYEGYSAKQMMNMVHLEKFDRDMAQNFDWIQSGEESKEEYWILFDYRNRNALDQNARMYQIEV